MAKILTAILLLAFPALTFAQDKEKYEGPKTFDLLVGGYSSNITVYRFYVETGKLAYLSQSDDVKNPSYLCVDNAGKFVYSVSENNEGAVYAYGFEPKTGKLTFINKQDSKGASPCYISVDKDRKNIFVANYSSGSISVFPLNKDDGAIKPASQLIQEKGFSINKERQEGPHVHTAFLSPDEKYLLYTDLGTDKINIYRYKDGHDQPLTPSSPPFVMVQSGSGPRHIDFSADEKYVYAVQELTAMITVFEYNKAELKQIQTITMLADGFKGAVGAADIHVSPNGRFLYASNRGDANEIVIYAINAENGTLTFAGRFATYGKTPRNFVIDPSGQFLLVGNQNSNNVNVFKLDKKSGKPTGMVCSIPSEKPTCLKFASATAEK